MADTASAEKFVYVLYHYTPTLYGAIASLVVFAILTALHFWRLIRHRAWYFIAFTVGGVFQLVGYGFRVCSHFDKQSVMPFAMQNGYILLAPALYAASIYMILGRLIRTCRAERLSFIPVDWVTRLFVGCDIASFTIQASGGSMAMANYKLFKIGEKVVIAGLCIQVAVFGFFICTSVLFHRRMLQAPTVVAIEGSVPWKRHLYVLYTTSGIILVRSIFRVIEYSQGNNGYLIKHEIFLYIFDALLMAAVMAIFLIYYINGLESKKKSKEQNEKEDFPDDSNLELGK